MVRYQSAQFSVNWHRTASHNHHSIVMMQLEVLTSLMVFCNVIPTWNHNTTYHTPDNCHSWMSLFKSKVYHLPLWQKGRLPVCKTEPVCKVRRHKLQTTNPLTLYVWSRAQQPRYSVPPQFRGIPFTCTRWRKWITWSRKELYFSVCSLHCTSKDHRGSVHVVPMTKRKLRILVPQTEFSIAYLHSTTTLQATDLLL